MIHILVQVIKYITILLFLVYTLEGFRVLRAGKDEETQNVTYGLQRIIIFMIHLGSFLVLYITTENKKVIGFYVIQLIFFIAMYMIYGLFYKNYSKLVLNNMCLLMMIGLIMLTRLNIDRGVRQFEFMLAGFVISAIIPIILQNVSAFRKFTWVYAAVGIVSLAVVAVAGATSYGAKLSIKFGGFSIQPSEFVKILFVFFIASMLRENIDLRTVIITSAVSALFVLTLVASKDLGGALLFYFTCLVMVYVSTKKFYIFAGGVGLMALASVAGYYLFSHVQTRVIAWQDPLSVIDKQGYQISQSLFAIGTGGWFGLGLNQGMPKKIPVVENDFIFSAISEEMGGIVAVCIIMICVSCFLMIFNVAMKLKDNFYRFVALGLGTTYALQVFLTIGGVTKFIPSTGVTLPLVSNGGSSMLSTMILFGIIQGLYIMKTGNNSKGGNIVNERQK